MKRYHWKTQKTINKYAAKYLQLYRNHRKYGGDDVKTARWRSHFVVMLEVTGDPGAIFNARYYAITKKLYK